MTDSPKPPSRRPSITSSTSHLRYPTFPPLSGSVEEWLSRSRPINMTSTPPSKSLSESWTTLSVSDAHSEDGGRSEQTDIGSLIDQPGPDDVASLDGRYTPSDTDGNADDGEDGESYDSKSSVSGSQELPSAFPQLGASIEDSRLTTQTAFRHPSESIEFVEPDHWPEIERVELKHTVRIFSGVEAAELKAQLPFNLQDSVLTATVQQTMTKKNLDTDKPFRVLYIGSSDFRNIILDKMGDVLVSSTNSGNSESTSTESSRYHVVPTSFGAGAVPNFAELLPIHVQLVVDECVEATSDLPIDKPSTISMDFKNRPSCTSSWTGSKYCVSSTSEWVLPDIAILFLSTQDTPKAVETQKLARIFMERHGVPTMVISESPLWKMTRESIPLNFYSLHMCVEARHPLTGKSTVVKRYPIDLHTFESITPGQLNRNLACLASAYPKKDNLMAFSHAPVSPHKPSFGLGGYTKYLSLDYHLGNEPSPSSVLRLLLLVIFSAVSVVWGHLALREAMIYSSQAFPGSAVSNVSSVAPSSIPTAGVVPADQQSTQVSLCISTPNSAAQPSGERRRGRSPIEDFIEGTLSPWEQPERSGGFEVQAVGDCHLVVKPPAKPAGRRHPKFNVKVTRGGQPLAYELSRLFEGVYSLKLDSSDAYGVVDVTITTNTRPYINQTTPVDFGTPWLKIANWKRAAHVISSQIRRDFNTAQTGLTEVYGRFSTDVQVLMGDVVKRAHVLRRDADTIRHDSYLLGLDTREKMLSRSKQLSEVVRRTTVEPFLAASSALQGHGDRVHREALGLMSSTWDRISTSAPEFDLKSMMEHLRNAKKCKTLDTAQRRAKGLVRQKQCGHSECSS